MTQSPPTDPGNSDSKKKFGHATSSGQSIEEGRELLEAAGFKLPDLSPNSLMRAECMRVARRLRLTGRRVFGFAPADDLTALPPTLLQLGVAMMELAGSTVAYLDANTHWPALPAYLTQITKDESNDRFVAKWLLESLALIVPTENQHASEAVPQLERVLTEGVEIFEHVLVDLTGFDRLGELDGAIRLMDKVILVARSGSIRESTLLGLQTRIGKDRIFGTLLIS